MKPAPFVHHSPDSVEAAVAVLTEVGHDGKVLAGGQSLIPMLNMRLASPAHLVDINAIAGLDQVEVSDEWVRVGALVRHAALERDQDAYAALPLLRQALLNVAHPAIRNRGTTVGSIAHADAAGEMPTVLALCDGVVEVAGPSGSREVPWGEFFLGPLETSLDESELSVGVRFRRFGPGMRTAFLESARRHGDYALAGVGVAVTLDEGGTVSGAKVGFVSVTDVPAVLDVSDAVSGVEVADGGAFGRRLDDVAERVRNFVEPESDIHASADYRRMLVTELTRRALIQAVADSGAHEPPPARGSNSWFLTERSGAPVSSPPNTAFGESGRVTVRVNGKERSATVEPRRLLSDFLRHDLRLTGTHVGCEHGVCGACTVLVDGQPMRSCLMFAVSAQGHEVTTVEGLCDAPDARDREDGTRMNSVQQAFTECHGLQCGFCTPGFLTTISAFLDENPKPTEDEAREAISGNLCRCTGYQNIVKSVLRASELRTEREDDEREDATEHDPAQRHTGSVGAEGGPA
ncbi:FAD binding domain-containing protein [Intrasporangium chromatireducens]|uniref:FAD binding domain-containing protein n=1 Tax=Intrasporangium chromatireducens TaxID=1386088 RepID=UPI0004B3F710